MAEEMSMEEFLGHSTSDSGGGGNYLKSWRKNTPPLINTFLHPKAKMIAVWQSPWPRMVPKTDRETGVETIEVWGGTFNGHEKADLYKKQYHREPKVTGPRVMEPMMCPMAMMIEMVHTAVRDGDLDWLEEMFRFEGTDPNKGKVLHAGGLYNAYGHKSVTPEQKAQISKAGISLTTAYRQNMVPKCNYVLTIVDADNVGVGAQVTTEKSGLGDKIKSLIHAEVKSAKCEEDKQGKQGLPHINPYCIQWEHDKNAKSFNDYYKAIVMRKILVTDEIQAVFDEDPPDVSYLVRKGNVKKLRDSMEAAYTGPEGALDFDAIFGPSERAYAEDHSGEAAANDAASAAKATRTHEVREEPAEEPQEAAEVKPAKRKRRTKKEMEAVKREEKIMPMVETMSEDDCLALLDEEGLTDNLRQAVQVRLETIQAKAESVETPAEESTEEEEMFGCDKCEHPMKASEDTCTKCGAKYNLETGELIPETKPKPRSRSAAAKGGESGDRIDF